ncbi:hypothetical protein MNBD_BACTEROID04-1012 [hydrothermal vent metagenome]|uniref:Uncharacterized protein n=1 Tax=hydrothermal vent metagenome TaxID=652676 RepID=A0A3B0UIM9_9ZZZZ
MQNLIQSDIFFFITSVAVVIVTISILVMLWYIIRILKNIKDVSEIVKRETVFFSGDLSGIRKKIKKLFDSLTNLIARKTKK